MGLAGFNWQHLNQRFLRSFVQPVNLAAQYGASVVRAADGDAWRCIGIYHLTPKENNGRHNVFVDVLDEDGFRTHLPQIAWTWWMDAPVQYRQLDKPDDEPACDIPIDKGATITLRVATGIASDSVGNLHARWPDEGPTAGNAIGHHSYYVVFQLQRSDAVVVPPIEPEKPTEPGNGGSSQDQRISALEDEVKRHQQNIDALWKKLDEWSAGK